VDLFVVNKTYKLHKTRKVLAWVKVLMIFEVDESTIKKTTKCKKNFSCLSKERKDLCKVTYNITDKVCFIECKNTEPCDYLFPYGHSFLCTCPVRKEIFYRYDM
jgi:hypothetical protein